MLRDTYQRLTESVYIKFNPEKLDDIPNIMEKYRGQEAEIYDKVVRKYVFEQGVEWRPLFLAMYQRFNPAKLAEMDGILLKYKSCEASLYRALCDKYLPLMNGESLQELDVWGVLGARQGENLLKARSRTSARAGSSRTTELGSAKDGPVASEAAMEQECDDARRERESSSSESERVESAHVRRSRAEMLQALPTFLTEVVQTALPPPASQASGVLVPPRVQGRPLVKEELELAQPTEMEQHSEFCEKDLVALINEEVLDVKQEPVVRWRRRRASEHAALESHLVVSAVKSDLEAGVHAFEAAKAESDASVSAREEANPVAHSEPGSPSARPRPDPRASQRPEASQDAQAQPSQLQTCQNEPPKLVTTYSMSPSSSSRGRPQRTRAEETHRRPDEVHQVPRTRRQQRHERSAEDGREAGRRGHRGSNRAPLRLVSEPRGVSSRGTAPRRRDRSRSTRSRRQPPVPRCAGESFGRRSSSKRRETLDREVGGLKRGRQASPTGRAPRRGSPARADPTRRWRTGNAPRVSDSRRADEGTKRPHDGTGTCSRQPPSGKALAVEARRPPTRAERPAPGGTEDQTNEARPAPLRRSRDVEESKVSQNRERPETNVTSANRSREETRAKACDERPADPRQHAAKPKAPGKRALDTDRAGTPGDPRRTAVGALDAGLEARKRRCTDTPTQRHTEQQKEDVGVGSSTARPEPSELSESSRSTAVNASKKEALQKRLQMLKAARAGLPKSSASVSEVARTAHADAGVENVAPLAPHVPGPDLQRTMTEELEDIDGEPIVGKLAPVCSEGPLRVTLRGSREATLRKRALEMLSRVDRRVPRL